MIQWKKSSFFYKNKRKGSEKCSKKLFLFVSWAPLTSNKKIKTIIIFNNKKKSRLKTKINLKKFIKLFHFLKLKNVHFTFHLNKICRTLFLNLPNNCFKFKKKFHLRQFWHSVFCVNFIIIKLSDTMSEVVVINLKNGQQQS